MGLCLPWPIVKSLLGAQIMARSTFAQRRRVPQWCQFLAMWGVVVEKPYQD